MITLAEKEKKDMANDIKSSEECLKAVNILFERRNSVGERCSVMEYELELFHDICSILQK